MTNMQIRYSEQDNGIRVLELSGRSGILGLGAIENKFAGYCTGDGVRAVVDLVVVDFLASIGTRLLTLTAISVTSRGGRMFLINPIPEVQNLIEITGIPAIIPIYSHLESAEAVLLA